MKYCIIIILNKIFGGKLMKKAFKFLSAILAALTVMSASSVTFAAPQNGESSTSKKILKYGLIGAGITAATTLTAVGAYKIFGEKVIEINRKEDFEKIKNCKNTITKAIVNVEVIPPHAFEDCKNLKEVDLRGAGIIGYCAFHNCSSLKTVKNTSRLMTVGTYVFSNCPLLEELDLSKVQLVFELAFSNCPRLKKINLSNLLYIWIGNFITEKDLSSREVDYKSIMISDCPVEELILPKDHISGYFIFSRNYGLKFKPFGEQNQ